MKKITNSHEKLFAKFLEGRGLEYIYQPPPVELADGTKYTADFYVRRQGVYYEVVGTRQAFSYNREKYGKVASKINLRIVYPDGTLMKNFSFVPRERSRCFVTGCQRPGRPGKSFCRVHIQASLSPFYDFINGRFVHNEKWYEEHKKHPINECVPHY